MSAKNYTFQEGITTLTAFDSATGVYTATADGTVRIEAQEVFKIEYDGKVYEHDYVPGSQYAFVYEISNVTAGSQISISSDFVWNSNSRVRITQYGSNQVVPVQIGAVSPSQNRTFPWTTTGMVSINLNKTVVVRKIKLVAGDYTADVSDVHLGSNIGFNITGALNAALKDGAIQPGDPFMIRIEGLCDANNDKNLYNGDGVLEIHYIAPYPQYDFIGAHVGDAQLSYLELNTYNFLSYYSPDEEDGLFVFEFDAEVGRVGSVFMSMGNLDLDAMGKYHRSALPYTIQGNKVLVDARGTLRTLALLFPAVVEEEIEEGAEAIEGIGAYDTEHTTITLSNVLDKNGNAFLCNAQGSVGSYSFVMGYKEIIDEAYMDGDNVAEGDEVTAEDEISLWISNSTMKFDGIDVAYFVSVDNPDDEAEEILEQRHVLVTDFAVEQDPLEGVIVTFTMPEMPGAAGGSTIRVSLQNARTADGMPHYMYIEFKAKEDLPDVINTPLQQNAGGSIYRLDGTIVKGGSLSRGIYVQNGKKYIKR